MPIRAPSFDKTYVGDHFMQAEFSIKRVTVIYTPCMADTVIQWYLSGLPTRMLVVKL